MRKPTNNRQRQASEQLECRELLAGSSLFVDTATYAIGSNPSDMVSLGDRALFTAAEAETGRELWATDGTSDGTVRVADIVAGPADSEVDEFVVVNDVAFFLAFDGVKQNVWRSDGTAEGTREFYELPETGRKELAIWGDRVLLYADGLHVLDPVTAKATPFEPDATSFTTNGTEIYYAKRTSDDKLELWYSDETESMRILDSASQIWSVGEAHWTTETAVFNLSFQDEDGNFSGELYRSDGTESGTYPIANTFPEASRVSVAFAIAEGLYFNVEQGSEYVTYFGDGTTGGTSPMENSFEFYPGWVVELEDELVLDGLQNQTYTFDKQTGETELLLDGGHVTAELASSEGGTFVRSTRGPVVYYYKDGILDEVADFTDDASQIQTRSPMISFGDDKLLLTTWWSEIGEEPAAVDASEKSRELLPSIGTGRNGSASFRTVYQDSYVVNLGRVVESGEVLPGPQSFDFFGSTAFGDLILGRTYDRLELTHVPRVLTPDWRVETLSTEAGAQFFPYGDAGDRAYFAAESEGFGSELWVTDGTPAGTRRVTDINPGDADSLPLNRYLGTFGKQAVFYTERNGQFGDLWISDGRNTKRLLERSHSSRFWFELFFGQEVNDQFVFTMRDAEDQYRLWRTNGTSQGTVPFPNTESLTIDPQLARLGDYVYVFGHDGERSRVWRTNGVDNLEEVDVASRTDSFGRAIALDGKLFYLEYHFDGDQVYQSTSLWSFDGVNRQRILLSAGTPALSSLRGRTVFSVTSGPVEERGVWITDGSRSGTQKVTDQPGSDFGEIGSRNLFMAFDPVAGNEPHELTFDPGVSFRQDDQLIFSELGEISLPVTLLARPDEDVTVRVTVSDGSEAVVTSEDLVFTPDNWSEDQFAIIAGRNDKKSDGDRRITVRADVVQSGDDYKSQLIKTKAIVGDVSTEPSLDDDGNLTINGSDGDDDIRIKQTSNDLEVTVNGATFRFLAADVQQSVVTSGEGADRIENTTALPSFVESGAGDDTVLTGDGKDTVYAGADDDVVRTGRGRDTIYAGFGDDDVQAGNGRDKVLGGRGEDTLNGGGGSDIIDGGSSNDVLLGASGSDKINGQSGADLILGGTGKDELLGGTGRDLLFGGDGLDSLRGGNDADIVVSDLVSYSASRLREVHAEWRSSRNYDQRTANILGTGVGDRENGDVFLRPGTEVTRDADADSLFGGPGRDWFFAVLGEAKDKLDNELLSEL